MTGEGAGGRARRQGEEALGRVPWMALAAGVTPDVGESAPAVEDDAKVIMETFGETPDEVQLRNPSCAPAPGRMERARKRKSWWR